MHSKQHYIAMAKQVKVESPTLDELAAQVYGDTGIITGRWSGSASVEGRRADISVRFTDTFIKRLGRWQVIASQETQIAAQGAPAVGGEVTTVSG